MRTLKKSNQHFQKAVKKLPLGVSSNFRYWGDDKTIYVKRGKGGRIWDIDDNEYIDMVMGCGPVTLGHCDNRIDNAIKKQLNKGILFSMITNLEVELAAGGGIRLVCVCVCVWRPTCRT